jgi:hypothetical protein
MVQAELRQANRRGDRRQSVKRSARAACRKGGLGLGPNLAASLLDVSQTGSRLVVTAPLEKGQQVEVTLEGIGGRRPVKLLASVVWCVPAADGNYCVGCTFEKRVSYLDLSSLVSG